MLKSQLKQRIEFNEVPAEKFKLKIKDGQLDKLIET